MKKFLFTFLAVFLTACLSSQNSFSFEKLKYIGEISIEKNIRPVDIALDESGGFFVADAASGKIVIYNKFGNLVDKKNIADKKLFTRGGAVCMDSAGSLIVIDTASNKITKCDSSFNEIFTIGGTGYAESQFRTPTDISVDQDKNFYVVDSGNRRLQVFNLDGIFFGQIKSGERETTKSSYKKKQDGKLSGSPVLTLPYLSKPLKVSVDETGKIYILDFMSTNVYAYNQQGDPVFTIDMKQILRVKKIKPVDIVVRNDNIFILTDENIKVFDAENGTYVTNIGSRGKGRGQFLSPVALDMLDNLLYVLDAGNSRVQIMEYGEKKMETSKVERTLEEKTKIAIFDFRNSNALSKKKEFGETVSEMFITSCVNTKNFIVVERKEIKRVLDELQFNMSDMIDMKTAKKVGKILGVDYGIVGSVAIFEDGIEIDVRFIELETGVIVLAESKRSGDEINLRKAINETVGKIERIYINRVGAPQSPGGFYTLGGIKSVYIRWDKSPDDDVSVYKIYRSESPDDEFSLAATVSTNEYKDENLKEGAEYFYRISLVNSKGNESKLSEIIRCKTREKPTFGYVLKVKTHVYVKMCKFSWSDPSKEEIKEYRIFRSDSESGEYTYIGSTQKTQFEDEGLEDGKTYFYRIKKVFPDGQESQFSNSFSCETEARPQPPAGLSAESHLARKVQLFWDKSKVDKDISKYHIFRSEFPDGDFKLIKTIRSNKYIDIKLLDNTTYYYKVQAVDKYGLLSDFSETVNATTKDIPSVPENVFAQSNLPRHVIITWDKNPEKDIDDYTVFRAEAHDGEYKKIGTITANEYTDKKLDDFKEYFYFVVATDKDKLQSKPSETVSARTKPIPSMPSNMKAIGGQPKKITVLWDKNPEDDIKHYTIFASKNPKRSYKKIGETDNNAFEFLNLKDKETYYFRVTATDKDGLVSQESKIVSATTKPLPPTPVNVTAEIKDGKVLVVWTAIQYEDLFGYIIYKDRKKVEIIQDNLFIDDKIKPGEKITYEISSMDNDKLESPRSQEVKIVIPKEENK
ncbi:MAG: hypothetical protein JW928_08375 [Candidatus Aureabacteria bacterium]|nr:hypothetical protein [Candidatus Auribacterota bacterium]